MSRSPWYVPTGDPWDWDGHPFTPDVPEPIKKLVALDDPDLEFICRSISYLRSAGLDVLDEMVLRLAIDGGRNLARVHYERKATEDPDQIEAERTEVLERYKAALEVRSLVYYARLGNRVKIGYTTDLRQRMIHIQPEEVLAVERGGPRVEAKRHVQFAGLRVSGEWFRLEGALADHISQLPDTYREQRVLAVQPIRPWGAA